MMSDANRSEVGEKNCISIESAISLDAIDTGTSEAKVLPSTTERMACQAGLAVIGQSLRMRSE